MVATMIDPGGQQVRLALQHLVDGQFHTIDRSPGTAINRQSFFFPYQCILDRHERSDRACHSRTGPVGSENHNVPQVPEALGELFYPLGFNAVIVCNQNKRSIVHHIVI